MRKEIVIGIFAFIFVVVTIMAYLSPDGTNQERQFGVNQKVEMNGNYNQFSNKNNDLNVKNAGFNVQKINTNNSNISNNNVAINNSNTSFGNINTSNVGNQNVGMNNSYMQHVDLTFSGNETNSTNTRMQNTNANMYGNGTRIGNQNTINNPYAYNTSTNNPHTYNQSINNQPIYNQYKNNQYRNNQAMYNQPINNQPINNEPTNSRSLASELIDWNVWKSNFLNKILDDCNMIPSLNNYEPGTWIWISFDVSSAGAISNVTVFSQVLSQEDKVRVANMIKGNAYQQITVFPRNSRRKSANVRTIMMLGDEERRSRPEDFHDKERVYY